MPKSSGSFDSIFIIMIFFFVFLILYLYGSHLFNGPQNLIKEIIPGIYKNEMFSDKYSLIPGDKLVVYQGNTLPDIQTTNVELDNHSSYPSVNGMKESDRSLFTFTNNKCDPSCCPSTYSCSGGCVCMTKEQHNFIGTRGYNNQSEKCSGISEI